MNARDYLGALAEQFRQNAIGSAQARYGREAAALTTAQLQTLHTQRQVTKRRHEREMADALSRHDHVGACRSRMLAADAQAQLQALEQELTSRSVPQEAFV